MIEIKKIDNIVYIEFADINQRQEAEQMLSDNAIGVLHLCDHLFAVQIEETSEIIYRVQGFVEKKTYRCPKDLWEYLSGNAP